MRVRFELTQPRRWCIGVLKPWGSWGWGSASNSESASPLAAFQICLSCLVAESLRALPACSCPCAQLSHVNNTLANLLLLLLLLFCTCYWLPAQRLLEAGGCADKPYNVMVCADHLMMTQTPRQSLWIWSTAYQGLGLWMLAVWLRVGLSSCLGPCGWSHLCRITSQRV